MDSVLQRRTATGFLLLMVGFLIDIVVPFLFNAISALLTKTESFPLYYTVLSVAVMVLLTPITIAGLVMLMKRMGAYAQFALAAVVVQLGFELVRMALGASTATRHMSIANISVFYGLLSVTGATFGVLDTVAMILLLRAGTKSVGARTNNVATIIVSIAQGFSLVRQLMYIVLVRSMNPSLLMALTYVGTAIYCIRCVAFASLAFSARKATLGALTTPVVAESDAYRGPTAVR